MKTLDLTKLGKILMKNKYVFLVLALGLALLLLPRRIEAAEKPATVKTPQSAGCGDALSASGIPLDTESVRLAALLREIRGVGETSVLLSAEGAVVVCTGGDDAEACYMVTNAVSAYTGLGSDKITVMKMK